MFSLINIALSVMLDIPPRRESGKKRIAQARRRGTLAELRPPALTVRALCSEDSCVPDSSKKDGKCWGSKVTIWLDGLGGLVRATPKLVANHPKRLVINYLLSKKLKALSPGAARARDAAPGQRLPC